MEGPHSYALALSVPALVVAGLGAGGVTGTKDAPPSTRVDHAAPGRVVCSGPPSFPPRALKRPGGYERTDRPAARALRRFLRRHADEVSAPRHGWFLLARRGGTIQFGARWKQPSEFPYEYMEFTRQRGKWRWWGSGNCKPRAYHYRLEAATWSLDPLGVPPTPGSTKLDVLVQENNCASGKDAAGRILSPLAHYGRGRVTVTYFVKPLKGDQTCQGVPPTPATLTLDEPLGDRELRDGGPFPSTPPQRD